MSRTLSNHPEWLGPVRWALNRGLDFSPAFVKRINKRSWYAWWRAQKKVNKRKERYVGRNPN